MVFVCMGFGRAGVGRYIGAIPRERNYAETLIFYFKMYAKLRT